MRQSRNTPEPEPLPMALQVGKKKVLLTPYQYRLAMLIADGWTNQQIAERLNLSHLAVRSKLMRVFAKCSVSSRLELAVMIWKDRYDKLLARSDKESQRHV